MADAVFPRLSDALRRAGSGDEAALEAIDDIEDLYAGRLTRQDARISLIEDRLFIVGPRLFILQWLAVLNLAANFAVLWFFA